MSSSRKAISMRTCPLSISATRMPSTRLNGMSSSITWRSAVASIGMAQAPTVT